MTAVLHAFSIFHLGNTSPATIQHEAIPPATKDPRGARLPRVSPPAAPGRMAVVVVRDRECVVRLALTTDAFLLSFAFRRLCCVIGLREYVLYLAQDDS